MAVSPKVVGTERTAEVLAIYDKGLLSKEEYSAIKGAYTQHIIFYGAVMYTDAAKQPHRLGFGVLYRPPGFAGDNGFFAGGPAKHNYDA